MLLVTLYQNEATQELILSVIIAGLFLLLPLLEPGRGNQLILLVYHQPLLLFKLLNILLSPHILVVFQPNLPLQFVVVLDASSLGL